jgi:hypothetical protein
VSIILLKVLTSKVTWAIAICVALFFAGLQYRGSCEKTKELKVEVQSVQEVVKSYDKIIRKYSGVKSDTDIELSRLLSYEVCNRCKTEHTAVPNSDGQKTKKR